MKESTKRRKSKALIKEEKKQEEWKANDIAKKLAEWELLKQKESEMDNINAEKESYRQICHNMFIEGVIKQEPDGSFIPVDDPLERESIKSKSKQK